MKWTLKEHLDKHGVTPHQLAMKAGLSVNTVYPIARGEAKRVDLQTLDRVIDALDGLTGKRLSVCDLLERE